MKVPIARLSTQALVIAVVTFALFLASVGQPTRAEAASSEVRAVCVIVFALPTLGASVALCPESPFGTTPPPPEPIQCTPARFTGPPTFFTKPIVTVKYQFHGSCSRADMPQAPALNYRLEGSWTPGEGVNDPKKPNASESLEITGYEPYLPDRAPGGRLFMYWTARCNREPWLSPDDVKCERLGAYFPNDLREAFQHIRTMEPWGVFPSTRNAILPNDRQQWYAHFLRLTGPVAATKTNPFVAAPVPTPDMFTITNPVWNASVQQGKLVVKATPPKIGVTPVTELAFQLLDVPPNQPNLAKPNVFPVDTPQLLQGYQVPPPVTRGHEGRWEVRARTSGKAVPGPWSFPVQFRLFLSQPTQSQKQAPPIQQSSPLPSSSITQPSPIQQTAPLPPPSVMQAPAPSSAPTQMNRSSSMFRSRGVEEKGGTDGNQTVGQPAEMEKKP